MGVERIVEAIEDFEQFPWRVDPSIDVLRRLLVLFESESGTVEEESESPEEEVWHRDNHIRVLAYARAVRANKIMENALGITADDRVSVGWSLGSR